MKSADLGLAQELSTKKALHQLINDVAEKESLESNRVLMGSITIMALEHTITPTGVWTDLIGHISFEEPENSDQELAMLHLDYAISEEKKGNLKLAEESYLEAAKLQPDDERVIMATASTLASTEHRAVIGIPEFFRKKSSNRSDGKSDLSL